jgi:hypothetical protein
MSPDHDHDTLELAQLIARRSSRRRRRLPGPHRRPPGAPRLRLRTHRRRRRQQPVGPPRHRSGPLLCFAGHTDVVPTGPLEQWHSDPFEPEIRDGLLYGRGAADMKGRWPPSSRHGSLRRRPSDHAGSIALLLTSDEEGDATHGTVRVVETLKRPRRNPRLLHRRRTHLGATPRRHHQERPPRLLSGKLTVKGVQGHIAYPHLAKNPVHLAAPALAELAADRLGRRQRILSADLLAGVQHPGRHRRRPTSFPARSRSSSTSASPPPARRRPEGPRACDPRPPRRRLRPRLDPRRQALPHPARRPGRGGRNRRSATPWPSRPNCPPPAAPPTAASSPTSARRSSNSAR